MFSRDRASQALGMRIVRVARAFAELTMTVRDDMLNGHAICHGGFMFTLADSTFAFACNSYNDNTVARVQSIDFLAPAHGGDTLTAIGRERGAPAARDSTTSKCTTSAAKRSRCSAASSYRIKGTVVDVPAGA